MQLRDRFNYGTYGRLRGRVTTRKANRICGPYGTRERALPRMGPRHAPSQTSSRPLISAAIAQLLSAAIAQLLHNIDELRKLQKSVAHRYSVCTQLVDRFQDITHVNTDIGILDDCNV
jgi:hypothetical protein